MSRRLENVLTEPSKRLEVVELGPDRVFFPGLADRDRVDEAVAAWGRGRDHVLAVTRCWSQLREGDETRTRVYGALLDPGGDPDLARRQCVELIGRLMNGPVGVEVLVLSEDIPAWQAEAFDNAVVLWERQGVGS